MIGEGADVNGFDHKGFQALGNVVTKGDVEGVRLLLDHGANVHSISEYHYNALTLAMMRPLPEAFEIAELLIERGAQVNFQKDPGKSVVPLYIALAHDQHHKETVRTKFLLERGADPEIVIGVEVFTRRSLRDQMLREEDEPAKALLALLDDAACLREAYVREKEEAPKKARAEISLSRISCAARRDKDRFRL